MTYSVATAHLHSVPGIRESGKTALGPSEAQPDAFTSLSPGEQRIARALYEAQRSAGDAEPSWGHVEARVRSLDEVAGMERSVAGWNQVFKQLKAEGLIAEQTLGHVVARSTRLRRPVRTELPEAIRAVPSPAPSRSA
jgi:hypothetical protein